MIQYCRLVARWHSRRPILQHLLLCIYTTERRVPRSICRCAHTQKSYVVGTAQVSGGQAVRLEVCRAQSGSVTQGRAETEARERDCYY